MEITFEGGKTVTAHLKSHLVRTDQPEDSGGKNAYPSPFE